MAREEKTIAIAGAGSIGCYVGGCLALAGRKVALLARPRVEAALRKDGLRVSDLDDRDRRIAPAALSVTADPAEALAGANIVLVTVKSGATEEMAALIAAHASPEAVVVSLQNGVDNAEKLRARLAGRHVLAGMVPFNVVQTPEGEAPFHVHRASEGKVMIEDGVAGLAGLLDVEGLGVETHVDMKAVLWGKLLMNLNNALVALSDQPLATELADRRWRLILAAQIDEALAAMLASGIRPARIAGLRPALLPKVLGLPDWLFRRLARRMLAIDPEARSSMWDDLRRGRPTEIGELQGAVLALAERSGVPAPMTERVAALVREAEAARRGPPGLAPEAVRPDRRSG
ncbi:2-dehydropantoate 2-reductase [Mesorhizobium sp. M4B.F.Ca.ET.215.01.1.1]|uniref:2-dehydropantoate 2-reductase n=3 Tax=Mesorhizobium TaxID=68287 RepID=UPI000FD54A87|nr:MULTISPECIES: 2-dehydropantoate 2-reductase [unclassified Mesorhizobium]RUW24022.1 2-dehydropantoate 2-reductase [Mesorhizobium sp. M4B.F.Ca.ET.013.02.1.1]RWX70615.1 2-dehydropantoate 2-reductase [Mesorhizobium sp. M4B.F.Ca.ET.089.01.1.1]TGQ06267.1 2-dehydropantoate 2-reductase [Mesorhizobium sp. M4B.F.Ca.ET.215.01.1.1]TGQ32661.1 2-dehydropantoate 2-reductase [Mesorhizobium sp. M00.F.Ca.ET.220.01.1.1]TGQ98875.1 2-dehydropantoate 2-reductase [Mesorhizobium sp. M4B.F.Ca.ET.203.01.1.1]